MKFRTWHRYAMIRFLSTHLTSPPHGRIICNLFRHDRHHPLSYSLRTDYELICWGPPPESHRGGWACPHHQLGFNQGLDPWVEQSTGTFDYARARKGGLKVVIEHVFVDDEYTRYNYTVKQACRLLETFHRVLDTQK